MGLVVNMLKTGSVLIFPFKFIKLHIFSLTLLVLLYMWHIRWPVSLLNILACCWILLSFLSCIDWRHVIFFSLIMGVDFMRPCVIRVPSFWTLFIVGKCGLDAVAKAALPHSRTVTFAQYTASWELPYLLPHSVSASFFHNCHSFLCSCSIGFNPVSIRWRRNKLRLLKIRYH